MGIKKLNAGLTIFIVLILTAHIIYEIWSYIVFYYNPAVTRALGDSLGAVVIFHVILSLKMLFKDHEHKSRTVYKKLVARTVVQRASGFGMLVLLPVHHITGPLITEHKCGYPVFILLLVCQVLFWVCIGTHVIASFSNALISLGILSDMKKRKAVDIIVAVIFIILIAISSYVIIKTQNALYSMGGGV